MKIKGLLILTLILFLSCGVVTAADLNDSNVNIDLQESDIEATVNQISDNNLIKEDNNINEKIISDETSNIEKKAENLENIKTSSPITYTLTDDTWTDYFKDDGNIREDIVSEGQILAFEGEFVDRFMMINIPVNITSGQQQAYLTNCLIYVCADNTNITGLNINNTDYDEYVIYVEDVSNVVIKNNNISLRNNDDGVTTHTLDIHNSNNILIKNNNIYTSGPEENLNYQTGACVTISINTESSNNITIDTNNITTEDNGITGRYGTIYGVFLQGSTSNIATNNRITNNNITTHGKYYMYSISLLYNNNFLIENNKIDTYSNEYANGMQLELVNNGLVNNNTIYTKANNFTYPIYCVGRVGREMLYSTNNLFTNNTLYGESLTTYLYEFFLVKNSNITHSNLSAKVDYGTGIGTSQALNNIYEYNNINITFNMKKHISNPDAIKDSPTGITITTIQEQAGVNNTIRYNNITVYSPKNKTIPAINLISKNNTAYRNYLISSQGIADKAVNYTDTNQVYNNYPVNIKNVTIPLNDITLLVDQSEKINITVYDENNIVSEGKIEVYIDEQLQEEHNLTDTQYVYTIENIKAGTHNLTVNYIPLDDMTYNKATNTSTITAKKIDTTIVFDTITDTQYKDTLTITGKLLQTNQEKIKNTEIKIDINNKQYKTITDDTGEFLLTSIATTLGINNVTYTFEGNEYYNNYSTNTTFNVLKQDLLISFETIKNVKYNDNVTITGKFTDKNGKAISNSNVNIYINGKQYKARTDNTGVFTLTTPTKAIGSNNVTFNYGGNIYYNKFEINTTFDVDKQDLLITYNPVMDTKYGDNVTISGLFTDINGKAISKSNVNIYINGKQYKAKTDTNGVFTLTTPTKAIGSNNVTLSYGGNNYYNSYTTNTTFNVEKQDLLITVNPISDVKYGDNVTINGKFTDKNGKAISKSNVNVYINGKQYKAKTDSTGVFTLSVATKIVGINNVTLSYGGNAYYNSYETSTTFNVIAKVK